MTKRILVGLAALVIVAGVSARFSTVPGDDVSAKSAVRTAPKAVAQQPAPSSVPSDVALEITPTPPTPAEQANYQDAVMVRRYLDAFDECTDRAVVRGADYAFALCGHLVTKARAYSDRAGLGYRPTQRDVMAIIQRKIMERYGSGPERVIRDQSPFAY